MNDFKKNVFPALLGPTITVALPLINSIFSSYLRSSSYEYFLFHE